MFLVVGIGIEIGTGGTIALLVTIGTGIEIGMWAVTAVRAFAMIGESHGRAAEIGIVTGIGTENVSVIEILVSGIVTGIVTVTATATVTVTGIEIGTGTIVEQDASEAHQSVTETGTETETGIETATVIVTGTGTVAPGTVETRVAPGDEAGAELRRLLLKSAVGSLGRARQKGTTAQGQ
jgi:hypothetical protein